MNVLSSLLPEDHPVATLTALGCAGIFVLVATQTSAFMDLPPYTLLRSGANFGPFSVQGLELWRLLAHGALHAGAVHLLFNLYVLLMVGAQFETRVGSGPMALVLITGVLMGGIASALSPGLPAPSVGLSGGLLAVLAAYASMLHLGGRQIEVPQRNQLLFWIGFIFLIGLIGNTSGATRLDNAAHAGGALAGWLCGYLLARARTPLKGRLLGGLGAVLIATMLILPVGAQLMHASVPVAPGTSASERERHRLHAWRPCREDILEERWDAARASCERYRQATLLYSVGHETMMLVYEANRRPQQAAHLARLLRAIGESPTASPTPEVARERLKLRVPLIDETRFQ